MDFIDFDAFQDTDQLPQPQPALSLPISSNIESLGKKFLNFNNLTRNLLNLDNEGEADSVKASEESKLAEKYANLSLHLIDLAEISEKADQDSVSSATSAATLSTRLARVLNGPLTDAVIRETFQTLEAKIASIDDLVEPGVVGSVARKRLRGEIEDDLIKSQSLVLKEYQPVVKTLKYVEERVRALNDMKQDINEKLARDSQSTSTFTDTIRDLNRQKQLVLLKKGLLMSFREKFTLNEYEEFVLESGDINDEFFVCLAKAEVINENCSVLLSVDNAQLGLKIMSKSNQIINRAVERIISFTNKTLLNLYSLHTRSRVETLHRCLRYLKNKMNYFSSIISTFVEARLKIMVDEFFLQVNGNLDKKGENTDSRGSIVGSVSSDHSNRPLLLSAHDSVRFIGDLLAYIHSLVVNETEVITSIFSIDNDEEEFKNIVNDIISKILNSLSRPIKSRIDQVISLETKLSTSFQIFNLLELYSIIFTKQINRHRDATDLSEAPKLLTIIAELIKLSQDKISNIIKSRLLTVRNSNLAQLELNSDLQPPEWIIDFYSDLLPIIDQITTEKILNLSIKDNEEFLKLIVNEPIEIFDEHVSKNVTKSFSSSDQLILRANFLDLILSKIMPLSLLNDKFLEIDALIAELTAELTRIHFQKLVDGCKLTDFHNVVNMICPFEDAFFDVSIYQPIVENKLFNKDTVLQANEALQEFVPSALLDMQQALLKLNSPTTVNEVVTNSSIEFVKFYLKFDLLCQEYLGESLLVWGDYEVATLLGVEEAYAQVKAGLALSV